MDSTKDSGSTEANKEPRKMEVHHHAHHEHGKKTWRNYGWEFLMLFLAVFCGSMAEYFLDHRIEHEKGKEYVASMMEDIASDSVKINRALKYTEKQVDALDNLYVLLSHPPYDDATTKRIYILMKYTVQEAAVHFTKRTITQLQNSGGMRLLPNKASADEITKYSEGVEATEQQGAYYRDHSIDGLIKLNSRIFYYECLRSDNIDSAINAMPVKLATDDKALLTEYSNNVLAASFILSTYNSLLHDMKTQIPKTIDALKKANHLE